LAVGGVVDTANNYVASGGNGNSGSSSMTLSDLCTGATGQLHIYRANDSAHKSVRMDIFGYKPSAAGYTYSSNPWAAYIGNTAITGLRFYWSTGGAFAAQGKIRIYGFQKA
jgi:hypothetical protein